MLHHVSLMLHQTQKIPKQLKLIHHYTFCRNKNILDYFLILMKQLGRQPNSLRNNSDMNRQWHERHCKLNGRPNTMYFGGYLVNKVPQPDKN